MIDTLLRILKLLLPLLPFILFAFLNVKANLKKDMRNRQYLMPVFALLYCILIVVFLNKINELLSGLVNLLPAALNSAAEWISQIASGKLAGIGELLNRLSNWLNGLLQQGSLVFILFYLENVLFLLAHIILKRLLLILIKRICKPERPLHDKISGLLLEVP